MGKMMMKTSIIQTLNNAESRYVCVSINRSSLPKEKHWMQLLNLCQLRQLSVTLEVPVLTIQQ